MPAWNHTKTWTPGYYADYRKYVKFNAPTMKGRLEDCADLSMALIVDFAAREGLPLTFTDNSDIRYSSWANGQNPASGIHMQYDRINVPTGGVTIGPGGQPQWMTAPVEIPGVSIHFGTNYTWSNKDQFYDAVKNRINAEALFNYNTEASSLGPQSGDLLLSSEHAGLVIDALPAGVPHPKAADMTIASWVDPATALRQVNVLEYFRDNHGNINDENRIFVHFDYLNHRGSQKPKAELIYFRRAVDAVNDGFQFRRYSANVLM
ncbi:MAG: hypothetical protein JSS81_16125 [Acidobacteria bacterium]|nr:hypothetical protein [Acidobacteriota bacterium]